MSWLVRKCCLNVQTVLHKLVKQMLRLSLGLLLHVRRLFVYKRWALATWDPLPLRGGGAASLQTPEPSALTAGPCLQGTRRSLPPRADRQHGVLTWQGPNKRGNLVKYLQVVENVNELFCLIQHFADTQMINQITDTALCHHHQTCEQGPWEKGQSTALRAGLWMQKQEHSGGCFRMPLHQHRPWAPFGTGHVFVFIQ